MKRILYCHEWHDENTEMLEIFGFDKIGNITKISQNLVIFPLLQLSGRD